MKDYIIELMVSAEDIFEAQEVVSELRNTVSIPSTKEVHNFIE